MQLNETTRVYFERLASISPPDKAARYRALLAPHVVLDESSRKASIELAEVLGRVFATRSADDWQNELMPAGVPAVRADAMTHHEFMLQSAQCRANDVAVESTQAGLPSPLATNARSS